MIYIGDKMNYLNLVIVAVLVLLSGLFSGLTLGLLGLDKYDLERKIKIGDKKAKKVYSVRKKGNLLLCTLLLGNVAVNSAIAIFLGSIASGVLAGVISTGLIVIFGEIIPQATISRYALEVGAKTVWIVKIFMFVLFPVCWPIAKSLDLALGEEMQTIWSKHEIKEIIKTHRKSSESSIGSSEESIMLGALSFSNKIAEEVMTPRIVVFAVEANLPLTPRNISKLKKAGFTRIPVYEKNIDNITGVLYSKDLINLTGQKKVKSVCRKGRLLVVKKEEKLDTLLRKFIRRKIHLAAVFDEYKEFLGIVTLEDVLEEVLRKEIVDEYDKARDMRKFAREKSEKKRARK